MFRPRWYKIVSDLLSHPVRSLLVIASIATGLIAIGMIARIHVILAEDIRSGYAAVNPANIQVMSSPFDDDFVSHIRRMPGVSGAQGAWNTSLQIKTAAGEWEPISIKAQDFSAQGGALIGQPILLNGSWPPGEKQIALDINMLPGTGASLGHAVQIKLPSGTVRRMQVTGLVKDQTIGSSGGDSGFFLADLQGYVDIDTLAWLDQPVLFNTLYATVGRGREDRQAIGHLAGMLVEEFETNGYQTGASVVRRSSEHPNLAYVDAMSAVIFMLGFLVVFLSGFLITNTFSALLNQQVEQIGIMKTIGASRGQVIVLYMVLILVYSLIALGISLPLSSRAADLLLEYLSGEVNFILSSFRPVPLSILLQCLVALLVPQIAGLVPILSGTRISVRQALSGTTSSTAQKTSLSFRMLARLPGISRPLLISLRNTFRKRGRLLLTLFTLTLGGATFISTFNVRSSLESYIDRLGNYFLADVNLTLEQQYRVERVTRDLLQIPGVKSVEAWSGALASIVEKDGSAGATVHILAPPADSLLIEPILIDGRWLEPGDENMLTLSEVFLERYPDLGVGGTIRLKIGEDERDWRIVGFFQFAGHSSGMFAYANYEYLSREFGQFHRSASYRIVAEGPLNTLAEQEVLAARIENELSGLGYQINDVGTGLSLQETTAQGLNILTTFLLIMSLLLASVGGIGLAGTMSLNVMERTHEIGVMRAVGGSNRAIINIVLVEGVLIGLLSWFLGVAAALPLSKQLADILFQIIFDRDAAMDFTLSGNLIWLALVLALSVLASVIPAIHASRLTIREVLAYE